MGVAAPDLAAVEAGFYDAEAGTFSDELVWDALNERLKIDFKATLGSLTNWKAWRPIMRIPAAGGDFDYLFEGEPYDKLAFAPPEEGGVMFGTISLTGQDLPTTEETWRLIFVSINLADEMNRDIADIPTGPYVDLTIPARPEQVVFENPGKSTNLDFSVAVVPDAVGVSEVTVTLLPAGDGIAIGDQLWLEAPQGTTPRDMGSFDHQGTGTQTFKFRYETPSITTTWKIWASPYSKFHASKLITSGPDADPFKVRIINGQAAVSAAMEVVAGVLGVKAGGITNALIDTFAVTSTKLADAAVVTAKLDNGVVTTVKLGDRSVTALKIDLLAVETANIQNAAVTTAKIQNLAITNALIANAAITDAKINDLSANKIGAGTITAAVSMTAPTLVITSGTVTVNIDATNKIKVTDSSGAVAAYSKISGEGFLVEDIIGPSSGVSTKITKSAIEINSTPSGHFGQFKADLLVIAGGGGNSSVRVDGFYVNGTRVVSAQQASISAPFGGLTIDSQARTAINTIISRLQSAGMTL